MSRRPIDPSPATLCANYGIYGPAFEHLLSQAVPGKEDYQDSEKYEIKAWDFDTNGTIAETIEVANFRPLHDEGGEDARAPAAVGIAHLAEIDRATAAALAEADARRLAAVQPQLVGALHAAADAEVMKAAAQNMNLVSLLGGKSPQELFEHLLSGTPLERTARDMRARSKENGHRVTKAPDDGE